MVDILLMNCGAQQKWSPLNLQQSYRSHYNKTKCKIEIKKIIENIEGGKQGSRVSNIPRSLGSSCLAEMSLVGSREFMFTWSLESTVRSDQKWLISWWQSNYSYTREPGVKTLTALNNWPKRTIESSLHQSQRNMLCSTPPSLRHALCNLPQIKWQQSNQSQWQKMRC